MKYVATYYCKELNKIIVSDHTLSDIDENIESAVDKIEEGKHYLIPNTYYYVDCKGNQYMCSFSGFIKNRYNNL